MRGLRLTGRRPFAHEVAVDQMELVGLSNAGGDVLLIVKCSATYWATRLSNTCLQDVGRFLRIHEEESGVDAWSWISALSTR